MESESLTYLGNYLLAIYLDRISFKVFHVLHTFSYYYYYICLHENCPFTPLIFTVSFWITKTVNIPQQTHCLLGHPVEKLLSDIKILGAPIHCASFVHVSCMYTAGNSSITLKS